MKVLSLKSTERATVGKGSARSLRREGFVPAVLYGQGVETVKLLVGLGDLNGILRASKTSQFLLELVVGDDVVKKVTIKELQKRPVSGDILHVDFYEVSMDRKIKVSVPVNTIGTSKGVELGGMLQIIRHEIEVLCLPDSIPDSIDIDITDLDIGDSCHVMDISFADGIEVPKESNFTVLTVLSRKITSEDVEEEVLGEEAEEDEGEDEKLT